MHAGPISGCEPYRATIEPMLAGGLSAQRVYQDLVGEHGFVGSYYSVRRFVRKLGRAMPLPFRRMECEPGQEAQMDFGTAPVIGSDGRRRKTYVFRIVLSHSRKAYSEAVCRLMLARQRPSGCVAATPASLFESGAGERASSSIG